MWSDSLGGKWCFQIFWETIKLDLTLRVLSLSRVMYPDRQIGGVVPLSNKEKSVKFVFVRSKCKIWI
jgi:hypothetical protein